jgi:hypothetical protein
MIENGGRPSAPRLNMTKLSSSEGAHRAGLPVGTDVLRSGRWRHGAGACLQEPEEVVEVDALPVLYQLLGQLGDVVEI